MKSTSPLRLMKNGKEVSCLLFRGNIIDELGTEVGALVEIVDVQPNEDGQFAVLVRTSSGDAILRSTAGGMPVIYDAVRHVSGSTALVTTYAGTTTIARVGSTFRANVKTTSIVAAVCLTIAGSLLVLGRLRRAKS